MSSISPDLEAVQAFAQAPQTGPFVMVNLLKFKPDGGAAEYAQYSVAALKHVQAIGGRLIFMGRVEHFLVGAGGWDAIAMVEYPSRQAFLAMVTDPEYLKSHEHRERGLEATELFAVSPGQIPAATRAGGQR
jgi:uncharacterized protein (DUF1330 family)